MEEMTVMDLMVPLEEYATVSEDATLLDAVIALEEAQEKLDRERYLYLHRAILVYDKNKKIVGKISQLDALRALEPKYLEVTDLAGLSRAGAHFSLEFLQSTLRKHSLWERPLEHVCRKAAGRKVKDFMYTPSEGEYVAESASLNEAVHLLVMGHHQSLLVTRGKDIVGVLRLTDVFKHVFQKMKACAREN